MIILDLKDLTAIADYFIICSGENPAHIRVLAEAIEENFSKNKIHCQSIEGLNFTRWVLMDYGDVIIHIFDDKARAYYELEKLWLDAPRIPVAESRAKQNTVKKAPDNPEDKGRTVK
ncbi:MAG: ribosome silencing factor [Nitrospirae bacterium]|nr:ribosome silencing factor [Nitrospirota bacterium]